MQRNRFIKTLLGATAMNTFSSFNRFTSQLEETAYKMPVLFVGHGSPMNGIEDNDFSRRWKQMASEIPLPTAVLVVSAHWFTSGTQITAMDFPKTIHDFGGFPKALFDVQYPAPGNPALAKETAALIHSAPVTLDHDWGLDHGTWTIVRHMYPEANIPILQLSIDYNKPPVWHYEMARELSGLRKKGVLIIGSGNMVHNLRMAAWDKLSQDAYGFDWAMEANEKFKHYITSGDFDPLIHYQNQGRSFQLSVPTPEHYLPLLYTLGLKENQDKTAIFNDRAVAGSLTMTSVKFG